MKVQCHGCRTEFNIPDDKIPAGRALKILCPKCKAPIEINTKPTAAQISDPPAPYLSETTQTSLGSDPFSDYANSIDVVDEGVKTALLCASNVRRAEKIVQGLQELDYWVVHAPRSGFALGKLHHNNYDLVVLEEDFDSDKSSSNLVLHHVQLLPMHLRRQFYLCLISDNKPTLDAKLAFTMGVNLILNSQDLEKAKVIFARAMKEYRNFYAIFNAELGRKQ